MIYILLSILSSTSIFILFKGINKIKTFTFHIIIINYVVATLLGLTLSNGWKLLPTAFERNWFLFSIIIGLLFIIMFFFIGLSSQKAGVSITTVASKMSVIIPILFSVLYYSEIISWQKITGISLALIALLFTVWKKPEKKEGLLIVFLPVILFMGLGIIDSLVKYVQQSLMKPEEASFFTAFVFIIAFVSGIIMGIFKKNFFLGFKCLNTYLIGTVLGVVNFGSIYFFILSLNKTGWDSSIVFGVNNIGIVLLSVVFGLIIFREKLKLINWVGISFSLLAIWFLTGLYGIG